MHSMRGFGRGVRVLMLQEGPTGCAGPVTQNLMTIKGDSHKKVRSGFPCASVCASITLGGDERNWHWEVHIFMLSRSVGGQLTVTRGPTMGNCDCKILPNEWNVASIAADALHHYCCCKGLHQCEVKDGG